MRQLALLFICALLAACATKPVAQHETLLHDHLFALPAEPADVDKIFALSPAMERYLESEINPLVRRRGYTAMVDALYNRQQLKLEYESAMTRNAAQAFEARSGNCLSLVIMTAAFAKRLGLSVRYQSVINEETWSRAGNLHVTSGHVNLALGPPGAHWNYRYDNGQAITVDFLPSQVAAKQRIRAISEDTVVAMYLNNRAAELLAVDRVGEAYWLARAAVRHDPGFLPGHVTLGVVYTRHGNPNEAEQVFRSVLATEPANSPALSNLAYVLEARGRIEEASHLRQELAQIEPHPPFHFFHLGMAAMRERRFDEARQMFARELRRAAYYHEFHFWLAAANYELGDLGQSRKHLRLALENSTTREDRDLYATKLERVKSWRER